MIHFVPKSYKLCETCDLNHNYAGVFRQFSGESPGAAFRPGKRTALHVLALAVALVVMLAVPHADDPRQAVAPNQQAGGIQPVLDLAALASLPGYAFAQVSDSTPPTFVSSELDLDAGVLTITFSETIDAANVVPAKMHIRESGNYTHGTTLSAGELDTDADGATISFALTPSHLAAVAGLTAPELTIEPGAVRDESGNLIVGTFDASTRVFVDATSISQEDNPRGIAFSSDGTKMFVIGIDSGVGEYALSVPFDASTIAFVDATAISQEDNPRGIAFSNDGTRMFVIGITGDDVNEYVLSAPFDASTRTFVDATPISAQDTVPTGIAFSNDGTRMFVIGNGEDKVSEYELSAPFDASTRTFVDATGIRAQDNEPRDIAFSNDGTRMFVIGNGEDKVSEYALSAPFDASTGTFVDATSIRSQETAPTGMAFSSDGAKMFVIGFDGDDVNEYALSSVYPVTVTRTPPTFVSSVLDIDAGVLTITFSETIDAASVIPAMIHVRESGNYAGGTTLSAGELGTDGATISFILNASRLATIAGLSTPELTIEPGAVRDESGNLIVSTFDASTGTFVDTTPISDQDTVPTGIAFSSDGTRMFVIGNAGADVNEYELSTPFDASTRTFVDATPISEQEDDPRGIAFSSDGTRMFVIGTAGDDVNEYELSTPFDASTIAFVDATSISSQDIAPTGMAFSSDGAKMFVIGNAGVDVNEYELSTPFDASTRTFVDATSISRQEESPTGMAFSSGGAKMFVIGSTRADVNEYTMSTPFDASTRSFVDATSVLSRQGAPADIAFSNDGTRMFVIGSLEAAVTEYALSSVYPIVVGKAPSGAFATTWNVASSPHTIRISVHVISGGDLHVDWGDSNTGTFTADGIISHTYQDSGKYQVSMTGDLARINLGNSVSTASNLASIDQWGDIEWSSMANAFRGASNMEYRATDAPDLSDVTDMSGMFGDAASFNGDISGWDVSSVEDMRDMFEYASSFNHPLDSWNVSKVTSMSNMFTSASSFNHPLDSWNVSAVTDMSGMFFGAHSFDQNLGNWYVVPADTTYATSEGTLKATTISTQNTALDDPSLLYGIGSGDNNSTLFNITDSKTLMFKSDPSAGTYNANVTASGTNVFEDGNNWRMLDMTVTGQANADPVLGSIGAKSVNELAALSFTATATDGDNDALEFMLAGTIPAGASITSGGAFSWTPSESQDGTHTITIQVQDGNGGSDSETITVTVSEVNEDPVLNPIGPKSVNQLEALTFTATATDGDVIGGTADTLEFSLGAGAPTGASINQNTGAFSWTPTASQVGMHTITFQVEDGAGATDSEAVTVTVSESNENPVLGSIGAKSVNELATLSFTATATDGDNDALEFTLAGTIPAGASITSGGAFSWTPSESQDGTHSVTARVSDGNGGSDSETITVTVSEVNQAPALNPIGPKSVNRPGTLAFTATASDGDVIGGTADSLEFSLAGTIPAGASITSGGAFSWTPTASQIGTHTITIQVEDSSGAADSGAVTVRVTADSVDPPTTRSGGGGSSKQAHALALDLGTVRSTGLASTPQEIVRYLGTFDPDEPIQPAGDASRSDPPLAINGSAYLLGGTHNTLEPQALRPGEPTDITFTVYSTADIVRFAVNMSRQGADAGPQANYTLIRFSDGAVSTVDPGGLIADADVAITRVSGAAYKYRVQADVEFADVTGLTDMVITSENARGASTTVHVASAFEVLPPAAAQAEPDAPEPDMPAPEPDMPAPEPDAPSYHGPPGLPYGGVPHVGRVWPRHDRRCRVGCGPGPGLSGRRDTPVGEDRPGPPGGQRLRHRRRVCDGPGVRPWRHTGSRRQGHRGKPARRRRSGCGRPRGCVDREERPGRRVHVRDDAGLWGDVWQGRHRRGRRRLYAVA